MQGPRDSRRSVGGDAPVIGLDQGTTKASLCEVGLRPGTQVSEPVRHLAVKRSGMRSRERGPGEGSIYPVGRRTLGRSREP